VIELAQAFDVSFDKLVVRYKSPKISGWFQYGFDTDSESLLNLGLPGAIMLLGKNGSGKSRFLESFQIFGLKQSQTSPEICLRYSVPSVDEHLEYLQTKDFLTQTSTFIENKEARAVEWGHNLGARNYEKEVLDLPFHNLIILALIEPIIGASFKSDFGCDSSEAVLRLFEFSEQEIQQFIKRMESHQIEFAVGHPEQKDLIIGIRENLNFRDYFPEFFLALLTQSNVHKTSFEPGPGSFFDSSDFLESKQNRVDLVTDLKQLFEGTTHVEVECRDGDAYISFVNDKFGISEVDQQLEKYKYLYEEHENACFPYDLFRFDGLNSSNWLKIFTGGWKPFRVLDLTFRNRQQSIDDLVAVFAGFVSISINEDDTPSYQLEVNGLEKLDALLDQVSSMINRVDVGISKIERLSPTHDWRDARIPTFVDQKKSHDFTPIVGWRDAVTGKLLPLESCSDGQLDVLRILVSLSNFKVGRFSNCAKFLLADEFDRHLHPAASQQLLTLIDQFAKDSNSYVILSTHSIGSMAIHRHTQLFAVKELDSTFRITTERQTDSKVLSITLGVPELDLRKLKKLFLLVEGNHEVIILGKLIEANAELAPKVELLNLNGLYGLANFWRSYLQHENADVLIVYDRRNIDLESEWLHIKSKTAGARFTENLWSKHPGISQLLSKALNRRKDGNFTHGDTELTSLARLLKEILDPNENQIRNVKRLHLHGLEVPDVVDCLPISAFPKAKKHGSWTKLRQNMPELHPERFKFEFGINDSSVNKAVNDSLDAVHPEIQRLFASILGILELPEDWPIG
jgi:energy-coupling factor transporter ATP-binding protein EcfA2